MELKEVSKEVPYLTYILYAEGRSFVPKIIIKVLWGDLLKKGTQNDPYNVPVCFKPYPLTSFFNQTV